MTKGLINYCSGTKAISPVRAFMIGLALLVTCAASLLLAKPPLSNAFVIRQGPDVLTLADVINPSRSATPTFDNNGSNFDIMAQLLRESNLLLLLSGNTDFGMTLLIPNDLAANATAADLALALDQTVPVVEQDAYDTIKGFIKQFEQPESVLSKILLFHMIDQEMTFTELADGAAFETMNGQVLERVGLTLIPAEPQDGIVAAFPNARILPGPMFRAEASNGYLYVVDRVMFPHMSQFTPSDEGIDPGSSPAQTPEGSSAPPPSVLPVTTVELSFVPVPSPSNRPESEPSVSTTPTATPLSPSSSPLEDDSDSGPACFPLSAVVHLENGSDISLSQLSAGHVIRASESESSMVYLFTHKKHTGVFDFVRIITDGNHEVVMTKGHYIYANGILKAAGSVNIGDTLRTLDGPARVRSIRTTHDYGLFAPHTLHGDIVVNRVITSTYTTALHPVIAHVILWPLRALAYFGIAEEPLGSSFHHGAPVHANNFFRGQAVH